MSTDRRIYVDFDDVLCETALEFTRVLEREFGKRVAFEAIFSFDLGQSFGLTKPEVTRLMQRVHEPDVLAAMEPVRGAVEALQRWTDGGYAIWIITGRPAYTERASRAWLERHGVPYARLQFVNKYAHSRPEAATDPSVVLTLDQVCAMDFCLAVEDAPQMVRILAERTTMPLAMLARPWNAQPPELPAAAMRRVTRCQDWPDILARFPKPVGLASPSGDAEESRASFS